MLFHFAFINSLELHQCVVMLHNLLSACIPHMRTDPTPHKHMLNVHACVHASGVQTATIIYMQAQRPAHKHACSACMFSLCSILNNRLVKTCPKTKKLKTCANCFPATNHHSIHPVLHQQNVLKASACTRRPRRRVIMLPLEHSIIRTLWKPAHCRVTPVATRAMHSCNLIAHA